MLSIWTRHQPRRLGQHFIRRCRSHCLSTSSAQLARSPDAPFRMAVVGSGPAGFYTAYRVMSKIPQARVDMYESLPVPFGLVRYGVAPDHPEVKNCQDKFEEVASSPNFTFIGNTSVGSPGHGTEHCTVEFQTLMRHYDSILLAYGASQDKRLGIPGESTLSGIYSARQFVGWYNGLPDCAALQPNLDKAEEAVIIGQGNVALDVARMLLEDIDTLKKTDISEHALAELARSRVKRVHVVGRRGPMQASFTIKEVRELMKLPNVAFHPVQRSLIPEDIKSLPRVSKRLMEVILKGTTVTPGSVPKSWSLDNCMSPRHFLANEHDLTRVASTEFDLTVLDDPFNPGARASPTGRTVVLPSDIVFRSVGYKSVALDGFAEAGIQFDNGRGIVSNDGLGRVTRLVSDEKAHDVASQQVSGIYCAGWVKRGPTGVIASTMDDAFATGDAIVEDWQAGSDFLAYNNDQPASGWQGVKKDVVHSAGSAVTWHQWHQIDRAEKEKGQAKGKLREKFTNVKDMLEVIA